jgi:hypothetical protein
VRSASSRAARLLGPLLAALAGGCTPALIVPADGAGTDTDAEADATGDTAMGADGDADAGGGGDAGIDGGAAVTPTVAGQIVVTELMHDPDVVADAAGEWFEVYNPDAVTAFDLLGCDIRDNASVHTIARRLVVPPRAFRTLALFSSGGGFVPDYTYSGIMFNNNSADSVSVICGATTIDTFAYSIALAAMHGRSFSVDPAHYSAVDNDDPLNVCPGVDIYDQTVDVGGNVIHDDGTPGAPNPPCMP